MSTSKRLIEFVLNEQPDKFKTVLKEQITDRMVDSIYRLSLQERKDLFKNTIQLDNKPELQETTQEIVSEFYPEAKYTLKDGNIGILNSEERKNVSKLYENLNNGNKERMVKLLSESQESFNRVLKLANLESKKDKQ
jgi:hypothetical protein